MTSYSRTQQLVNKSQKAILQENGTKGNLSISVQWLDASRKNITLERETCSLSLEKDRNPVPSNPNIFATFRTTLLLFLILDSEELNNGSLYFQLPLGHDIFFG